MRLIELSWIAVLSTACSGASFSGSGSSAGGARETGGSSASGASSATGGAVGTGGGWASGGASGGAWSGSGGATASGGFAYGGASAGGGAPVIATTCPAQPPASDAPCRSGLSCTYGEEPRAVCRTRYDCHSTGWVVTAPNCIEITMCSSLVGPPSDGKACTDVGATCWSFDDTNNYDVQCACGQCSAGGTCSDTWTCGGVPAAGCPRVIPNLGQPCDASTPARCQYGLCPTSTVAVCEGGVWTWGPGTCPLSSP